MMLRLCLIAAVLAFACATEKDCCSVEDRHEVVSLWENVWSAQFTGRRVAIAQAIFARMFELHPNAQGLFSRVGGNNIEGPKFRAHVVRVTNGVDNILNLADDPPAMEKQMMHYGHKHKTFDGFTPDMFKYFLEASSDILPQVISCFNKAAWTRCVSFITSKLGHYYKH